MTTLVIGNDQLIYSDVVAIALGRKSLVLSEDAAWVAGLAKARASVEAKLRSDEPLYGIKTGFGASCTQEVAATQAQALATNLFRYHGAGVGGKLSPFEASAVLVVRLAQLAGGYSGMRLPTMAAIAALLRTSVIPCIPEIGSVGASGDLTPMSYVAAVLEGEREAYWQGQVVPSGEALRAAGLAPWQLLPKESLSIMNGTSVMTALVAIAMARANQFAQWHAKVTAWNSWLLGGQASHFDERLFAAKPHPGSIAYAEWVRAALAVTARPAAHAGKVQDPYSIRCTPHVVGVLLDALVHAERIINVELNGAGDNPLVCPETGDILHGGNFYGGHVGYVADTLKVQVASCAEALERQLMLLCHAAPPTQIPENLVLVQGEARATHHGFKALEITSSALVAEALKLSMPATAFSRSTEGHNQDKVPMATMAARDLRSVVDLSEHVLAISLLAAAQATDALNATTRLPPPLAALYQWVRGRAPAFTQDGRSDLAIATVLEGYRTKLGEQP